MKTIYRKYAPYLILQDATYRRTTKNPLLLYFLVVKTNVNYQVRPYLSLISLHMIFKRLITVRGHQQNLLILKF